MMELCLDFSLSRYLSCALTDGKNLLAFASVSGQNYAGRFVVDVSQMCLKYAGLSINDVEAIKISKGPGSFTSLRIAFAWAKGVAIAKKISVRTCSTFEWITRFITERYGANNFCIAIATGSQNTFYTWFFPEKESKILKEDEIEKIERKIFFERDISFELGAKYLAMCKAQEEYPPEKLSELKPEYLFKGLPYLKKVFDEVKFLLD